MADKASTSKEAQKYLAKGQIDKAIAEWETFLKVSPDGPSYNTVGDLHLKKGSKPEAIEAYHQAAKIFREDGFSLKALALYKKILNINPSDPDSLFALGELNEEKDIHTDAIKYYLAAADIYTKQSKKKQQLQAYAKILNLAPTNLPLKLKITEIFSKEGFISEASNEYISIGNVYMDQNEHNNARGYFKKAMEIQPSNTDAYLALCRLAEMEGHLDEAIDFMSTALEKAGDEDIDMLLRMGSLQIKNESYEEAKQYISKAIEVDSSNLTAKRLLGDVYLKSGDMEKAWEEYNTVLDEMIFKENFDEAVNFLNMFKDTDPIESKRKLFTLYKQIDNLEAAFSEITALSEIYETKELPSEALKCYNEALTLQPDNNAVKEKIASIEKEMGIETAPPEKSVEETLTEADIFIRYGLHDEAKTLLESLKVRDPQNRDIHLKLKTLYIETGDKEQAVTECLVLAELLGRDGDEKGKLAVIKEAHDTNPDDPRLAEKADLVAAALAAAPADAPKTKKASVKADDEPSSWGAPLASLDDYAEELSEAEFYLKQGLFSEATEIYRKLAASFPDNQEIKNKLAQTENSFAAAEPQTEEMETLSLEEFMMPDGEQLEAQELSEPELESDVLEIFQEFKKGISKELEGEDAETHYNLGIAYKEMGLIDDAINEFQTSKQDPEYFMQSSTTLGLCYMQKELYSLAIESFSAALVKTDINDDTYWSIKYDIAEAYEKSGNVSEALQFYTEIYGRNAKFRNVSEKIGSLKAAMAPPVQAEPAPPVATPEPAPPVARQAEPAPPVAQQAPVAEQPPPEKPKPAPAKSREKKSRVSYI